MAKSTRIVKFRQKNLDGTRRYHATGILGASGIASYTLCGRLFDSSTTQVRSKKIDCPYCIAIIKHCKSIDEKELV
jgi:hypothetical protein